ncbi:MULTISPECIES: glycosyltransferase [unclassified Arthrobacter]|uniref:glycosyltransferase n=1 Tax=unclassified Arthrobacter TaxID=235627 RepID=UPI002E01F065|nr:MULTISPECIES: glycosyltransferase family 2 protein [unclassified Arthrobacter]MEC5189860.1 hypothetical protein [Arthrobacter sp. MP_M4]MEC5201327.1 hypothetical protein [Arthrobacter sp. MP_M7]
MTGGAPQLPAGRREEYILPLRWAGDAALGDLVQYLKQLCSWIPVTVVDGSPEQLFSQHKSAFPPAVNHLRPSPGGEGNGKVRAVLTAVRQSSAERLVIADDDVRYTRDSLAAVLAGLDSADVVRPQNYFTAWPWHARWDGSRTLINRAVTCDFPGTLAVRRAALEATGGYDPVLFENLELIRTITAGGGRENRAPGLFIARTPPTARHFLRQRIRQAYDDFAQPVRLTAELALLPLLAGILRQPARRRIPALLCGAVVAASLAEAGRRRHHGREVFPAGCVLFAPLWVVERAVCIWIALALRLTGGAPYAGLRLKTAAHSPATLRLRHAGAVRPVPSHSSDRKKP